MTKMVFSQRILDGLIYERKIKLDKNFLTLLSGHRPSFELKVGYRILSAAGNGQDCTASFGQIRYAREVKTMGAEVFLDSLIYQNVVYELETGFIGEKKGTH